MGITLGGHIDEEPSEKNKEQNKEVEVDDKEDLKVEDFKDEGVIDEGLIL